MKHVDPKQVFGNGALRAPDFVTFTGVDRFTCVYGMRALSALYPIEWAMLLSPARQGVETRYADKATISKLVWSGLKLAAHLCGDHARDVMAGRSIAREVPLDVGFCKRLQVNSAAPDAGRIAALGRSWGAPVIAQARGEAFPAEPSVSWLYDPSGGRGKRPKTWPSHPGDGRLVGYAGGIGPDNVLDVLREIGSDGPYWIDMESGVRSGDRLDLDKAHAVCRAIWGDRS